MIDMPKYRLIWEQEDYPEPGNYHGKLIELEKTFNSKEEMEDFIKDKSHSAELVQKRFSLKKILKCDNKGNWCEEDKT